MGMGGCVGKIVVDNLFPDQRSTLPEFGNLPSDKKAEQKK